MIAFPIDFIRQIISQTLYEEHIKYPLVYLGGDNQMNLFSFYEQLQENDEVDRYVETYRDLVNQQNRSGLIANGIIVAPENPTITNLHNCLIIPLSFTCSYRVKMKDRDDVLKTINHLIEVLKGRKCDVAEFTNGQLFKVGTIANDISGEPTIKNGDYVGDLNGDSINNLLSDLTTIKGITLPNTTRYVYAKYVNIISGVRELRTFYKNNQNEWTPIENDGSYENVVFPPVVGDFTKYQVSMSFDSIRCDEPRVLNADEYCTISFGGSATIASASVLLGNQLTKLSIQRYKVLAKSDIVLSSTTKYWLEPLELPSGNSADTQISQLMSNKFISKTHSDSLAISLQYTFIIDTNIEILKQLMKYARYGIQNVIDNNGTKNYNQAITPNMIYKIQEIWSSWGNVDIFTYYAKIVESIDIENTESDTLSMTIPFQIQEEGSVI